MELVEGTGGNRKHSSHLRQGLVGYTGEELIGKCTCFVWMALGSFIFCANEDTITN